MKIAVLLAAPWIPGSVDMTEYLEQLRRLGHEPLMICRDFSNGPAGYRVESGDQQTLESPEFYKPLKLDGVIAFTWFNSSEIIRAIKQAGVNVLIRGDTDGLFSIRQFPAHHVRVRMSAAWGLVSKAAGIKHLLQRLCYQYRIEDLARLGSLEATDVAVVETHEAAKNVRRFLKMQKRDDLSEKVKVIPHFVADEFLNAPLRTQRADMVVAIGRWEDPQKNAPMLTRAIEMHLEHWPATEFNIIGGERGRAEFADLTNRHSQVKYVGPLDAAGVRGYLSNARVLLSASRWEGSPVVGNEALAMGVSVVGTPIPAFVDICNRGEFGTVAKNHSARALAGALATEMHAWEAGRRNPNATAEFWRPMLSSEVVVGELVRLLMGKSLTTWVYNPVMQAV